MVICMMSFFAPSGYATLLTNGGAEDGSMSPWTTLDYRVESGNENNFSPQEGDNFFYIEYGSDGDWMRQTGSSGLLVGGKLQLDGYYTTDGNDYGIASLSIFDASDGELASIDSSSLYGEDREWSLFAIELDIPTGAASWEVILTGKKAASGTYVDVHWDSMTLTATAVPEPTTIFLFGTGLFVIACGLRKKRT